MTIKFLFFLAPFFFLSQSSPVCRRWCSYVKIEYPFGIEDGCGSPLYHNMLRCITTTTTTTASSNTTTTTTASSNTTTTALFFETISGSYKVESIDYASKTLTIHDLTMPTCTTLQKHHGFLMTNVQSALIHPSPDTVFALVNCSIHSPILHHYQSLCFNFSTYHSCQELYTSCPPFKIFQNLSNHTTPACCFTSYRTLMFMSMNILDCTHYTSIYDADKLKEENPLDWSYGIKLSYSLPDTGCDRCRISGGTCGFNVETKGMLCICSPTMNSTNRCVAPTMEGTPFEGLFAIPFVDLVILLELSVFVLLFLL